MSAAWAARLDIDSHLSCSLSVPGSFCFHLFRLALFRFFRGCGRKLLAADRGLGTLRGVPLGRIRVEGGPPAAPQEG